MIHADLRGSRASEDRLTSTFFGLMRLLPDKHLIDFLGTASSLQTQGLDLSKYDHIASLEFWPWLPEGGWPDVIAQLRNTQTEETLILVIEVKHRDAPVTDQLGNYWQAAIKHFSNQNVSIIYLTHHRSIPKTDIQRLAGDNAAIYWLSWFDLYALVTDHLVPLPPFATESLILKSLQAFLSQNGYLRFRKWSSIPRARPFMSAYRPRCTLAGTARPVILSFPGGGAMNQETVTALTEADGFHRTYALLFEDLVKCINDKSPTNTVKTLSVSGRLAGFGHYYVDGHGGFSEHKRLLIINKNTADRFQFVEMLVKMNDKTLRGDRSTGFYAVCQHLGVDPMFPLLLVTGVFQPRDVPRFQNNEHVRQHWVDQTLLLNVRQDLRLLSPDCYRFNEWLSIESEPGKAVFKIRRLLDIDSGAVEDVVDELFSI